MGADEFAEYLAYLHRYAAVSLAVTVAVM